MTNNEIKASAVVVNDDPDIGADAFLPSPLDGRNFVAQVRALLEGKEARTQELRESKTSVRRKIEAILEPEGDPDVLELADIIDVPAVQSLFENFYRINGMVSAIVDNNGKVLTSFGWQDICTKFHRCHPETLKHCVESDTFLARGAAPGTFKSYVCKNGMNDMASPIVVAGRHLGNIYFGQFFYNDEEPDVEHFREQARRFGFDEAEYLAALSRVPRYDRETVGAIMTFYSKLAAMISSLSFSTVSLARALAEQRELQEEMGATLYSIGDGVIVTDKSTCVRRMNPVAEALSGWREADSLGKPLAEVFRIISEHTRQKVENPLARVIQNNVVVGLANHTLLISRDGRETPIADSAAPIRDAGGNITGVVLVFRDQTEERRVTSKLMASERFIRATLDGLSYMIAIVDTAGTILYVNQAWLDFGAANQATPAAITPDANYLDICRKAEGNDSDGAAEFADGLAAVLAGARTGFTMEYPCHSPDEKRWFTARVTIFPYGDERRAIIAHENITERKQIENTQLFLLQLGAQERCEDFFEALTQYLHDTLGPDYVCIDRLGDDLKTARTVAIYFDGRFMDNVTYPLQDTPCADVVGKAVCVFPHNVRGLFPQDGIMQKMAAESFVGVTLWSTQGEAIGLIAAISRKPLTNPRLAEAVLKLVGIRAAGELEGRQATEALLAKQRQLEDLNRSLEDRIQKAVDELRRKDQVLIHQSRMAAMGEMIGNIAHQWRQPLNALGLVIANIKDAYDYNELDAEYLSQAVTDSNRLVQKMSSTISDFANFFRPDKKIIPFSGLKQIHDAISLVEASFKNNNITIGLDAPQDIMMIGFPNEFSQVLLNLLVNAKDAIKSSKRMDGLVEVRLTARDGSGCITVRDNGGGIPEAVIGRIFDPYFSTKQQGSGIGLYMSKMIIEDNMNGAITACNIEGGAEFVICIPMVISSTPHCAEAFPQNLISSASRITDIPKNDCIY
jgi:PAS domain S-box-containing protein